MPKGVKMEKYRPKIHFSAEDYIINDPNGLVYYKGEYHLFHQYNINEQIYWGHAVSKDLVHWKRLPKAIAYCRNCYNHANLPFYIPFQIHY